MDAQKSDEMNRFSLKKDKNQEEENYGSDTRKSTVFIKIEDGKDYSSPSPDK